MTISEIVYVLRRRVWLVLAATLIGLTAGWLTAPGDTAAVSYQATTVLIADGGTGPSLPRLALLATSGPVPSKVAATLDIDRATVIGSISTSVDPTVATLGITGRSASPQRAEALAETTAAELLGELGTQAAASYEATTRQLTTAVEAARQELAESRAEVENGTGDADVADARLKAAQSDLAAALRELEEHQSEPAPEAPLRVLEVGKAGQAGAGGVRAPNSKPARAVMVGGFGLLLALGAAIGLHRLDSRIRTKSVAEHAFRTPVIAEVPPFPEGSEGELVALTHPSSAFVESYRTLRTMVVLWTPDVNEDTNSRVFIITSPTAAEGKTTTVAHLAAMLAEVGRSVIVVSADLRRPRVHSYFGRALEPGLTTLLAHRRKVALSHFELTTSVHGVRLVPSGPPVDNPAPLLDAVGELISEARSRCDFVLVDAPPLLVANDASELAAHADGVILVARAGQTTIDAAAKAAELLDRLDLPVAGVVLTAAGAEPNSYGYYRSGYYAESQPKKGLRPFWMGRGPAGAKYDTSNGADSPAPVGQHDSRRSNGARSTTRRR